MRKSKDADVQKFLVELKEFNVDKDIAFFVDQVASNI